MTHKRKKHSKDTHCRARARTNPCLRSGGMTVRRRYLPARGRVALRSVEAASWVGDLEAKTQYLGVCSAGDPVRFLADALSEQIPFCCVLEMAHPHAKKRWNVIRRTERAPAATREIASYLLPDWVPTTPPVSLRKKLIKGCVCVCVCGYPQKILGTHKLFSRYTKPVAHGDPLAILVSIFCHVL